LPLFASLPRLAEGRSESHGIADVAVWAGVETGEEDVNRGEEVVIVLIGDPAADAIAATERTAGRFRATAPRSLHGRRAVLLTPCGSAHALVAGQVRR